MHRSLPLFGYCLVCEEAPFIAAFGVAAQIPSEGAKKENKIVKIASALAKPEI